MSARLATEIWVSGLIRRVEIGGGAVYVARRGADLSGAVALRLCERGQPFGRTMVTALTRATLGDGAQGWIWLVGPEPAPSTEVQARLDKQAAFDPDLWVIEIEDRDPKRHLDEPIG